MTTVDVDAVMAGLKGFQRNAVDHVVEQFYGEGSASRSGRFLIADETGLGKSIIARGVIAKAIEHLQHVDDVDRIDIVYVCSSLDLATQNLRRLNVTGEEHVAVTTRLTMLAKESARLRGTATGGGKKVNLVSFTPGTSFSEGSWRQGSAPERALLTLILDRIANRTHSDRRVTRLLLHGAVTDPQRFDNVYVKPLSASMPHGVDDVILQTFHRMITESGALDRFISLRDEVRYRRSIPVEIWHRVRNLLAELRQALAKAGVDTLEPDLVILDEFQRFRHLLESPDASDAAELAHALFQYKHAKVLLLSATPYKPFTNRDDSDESHYEDFLATVRFLAGGGAGAEKPVADALAAYRRDLVSGADAVSSARRVSEELLPLMSRSERPPIAEREDMVEVRHLEVAPPSVEDIQDWAALRTLGSAVDSPVSLEYWKSIPYFANFMDGYRTADRVRARLEAGDAPVVEALARTRSLSKSSIEAFEPLDLGHGYLRALAEESLEQGWWKMLWMPPTMPYLEPGPVYGSIDAGRLTKRVIFSAWNGVPTAVASILSYEAERRVAGDQKVIHGNTPEDRARVAQRLQYRVADERAASMTTLALFWPHPALAEIGDPVEAARAASKAVSAQRLGDVIRERLPAGEGEAEQAWEALFTRPGYLPESLVGLSAEDLLASDDDNARVTGLMEHARTALDVAQTVERVLDHDDLPLLAAHAPGNIAYRALRGLAGMTATPAGIWRAALKLARGIRLLFNRPESIALLVTLYGDDLPYWRRVLDYCADGNLQAVLDEYLFQLWSEIGGGDVDDDALMELVRRATDAMGLRSARYEAHEATPQRETISFTSRFALRYGGKYAAESDDKSGVRQGEVRAAFNSPFAPFILASTSVGQEGIDFHWWSHAIVHWNLPSNPVDFEQREGRVNRFAGHAIRKNVAAVHWPDVLASDDRCVWRAAFSAAENSDNDLGEFSPWWIYPGSARIHRVLAHFPLSRDAMKYETLRSALTLYRLTLGQPRQEDMVDMLAKRGVDAQSIPTIDLRPPQRS